MIDIAMAWAQNHQQFLYGLAVGWAATHPRAIVKFLFVLALKVPGVDAFIKANGPAIRAWVKEGAAELDKDIDEADGEQQKPSSPADQAADPRR